ncbi:efflux RND transporter periplasmic adaptor subunit [Caballeronia sp. LjRoot34]|uniref:efflux RND transporter periplasmic adaptor subunit n=1 Tax=Caballeronia sp. LjRoot34 TaxID=3342325 RepID=UPI003ECEA3A1
MSEDLVKAPNLRRLSLIGLIALAIVACVLALGIAKRRSHAITLVQWTAQQSLPTVALAKVERGAETEALTLPGTIEPYYRAAIYAQVSGYLKNWTKDIGSHVAAGEELAQIDTPELDQQLDQAKADLATARANEQLANLTAQRWLALVDSHAVAQQVADEKAGDWEAKKALVKAAEANVRRLEALESFKTVVAPFDGIVTARKTDIGALINADSTASKELFEISDLHSVRIYVQVPQAYSAAVKEGLNASFNLPEYPGQKFGATLVSVSHAVEPASRSMLVELHASNAAGKLFSGTYCQVRFELPSDLTLFRVPATALVATDKGSELAVLDEDGKVTFRPVELGRDFGDSVEVLSGLNPNDRVIDNPPETLQNGDQVTLAIPTSGQAE